MFIQFETSRHHVFHQALRSRPTPSSTPLGWDHFSQGKTVYVTMDMFGRLVINIFSLSFNIDYRQVHLFDTSLVDFLEPFIILRNVIQGCLNWKVLASLRVAVGDVLHRNWQAQIVRRFQQFIHFSLQEKELFLFSHSFKAYLPVFCPW